MSRNPYNILDAGDRITSISYSKSFITLLILFVTFLAAFSVLNGSNELNFYTVENTEKVLLPLPEYLESGTVSPLFESFYNCLRPKLAPLIGKYKEPWLSFVNLTKECDSLEVYKAIDLRSVGNQNETKYIAYPRKDEDLVMVTIGIGQDVSTEMKLKEMYTRIKFYGVDPSSYINKDIYEKKLGGKYFHYGSSGKLKIRNYGVFLADNIHQKKIDFLWFGLKGHEYRILNQIHSDGPLDRKRV
ncbi:hypothetical protein B9Z55_018875 [Caenorhabditis nigoni]|uniref:Uncharacterized protein n=1 Tax=Caenorhabditis nigoni TaxID=1611254 RepID=A0A2G5TG54_9PELO|nr:hypothetical protein B9Z55_018875 [Caenorhabditis nigoni]